MCEGRRSQVVLLDERRLELLIQPKLFAGELLDIVASHFQLKEKEYFGIAFLNDTGQHSWLQLDKRVLEHDFPKACSTNAPLLTFYFRVKYFVESITQLRDSATVEAFYLQAKSLLSKGELEADSETVFQLAALVLQATYGDYVDESMFRSHLRRLPILPTITLKEFSSINNCEENISKHYIALAGQSRGDAIVNYLTIAESLPTYGQHYYDVKDKSGANCHLGLSYRGISQYEKSDKRTPIRVFLWKQLENLYFRDKKFTIEVHEARRVIHTLSSFNLYEDAIEEPVEDYDSLSDAICDPTTQVSVSRRTLAPANVTVYVWYASSPLVTKCIWSMAIAQHHFFLDRRHQKQQTQVKVAPCLSQIASELCRSVQSLSSLGSQSNISRSTSSSSLPSTILGGELSEESKAATIEMLTALHARKEALEEALKKKTEELKALCLKEGELTGEIPPEIPLQPGEARPQARRRIGTSFSISERWMSRVHNKDKEALHDLELEYEIQSKIASAAFQLANDCTARKSVRKIRKVSYAQATAKLKTLELKLQALHRERKANEKVEQKDDGSECSISSSEKGTVACGRTNLTDSLSSHSESGTLMSSTHSIASVPPCGSLPQLTISSSESKSNCRQRHQSLQHMPFSGSAECQASRGWTVTSSYPPDLEFDTISCASSVGALSLKSPYRNRFESRLDIEGSNLYSVPNRRASQVFDSQDDLFLSPRKSDCEKRPPSANIPLNPSHQYSNDVPLSSSYDERLWCGAKSKDLATISSECSSLETSFDNHSINSCDNYYDLGNRKQIPVERTQTAPKLQHFFSENSLHRDEMTSGNIPLSECNVPLPRKIVHVQSVPQLHKEIHDHLPRSTLAGPNSNHSLDQVAGLVNASMLRQDGKKSTMSLHPRDCLSPKSKTKEWIETSLDSPLPMRKSKSRSFIDNTGSNRNNVHDSIYENHVISLAHPQDCFFEENYDTKCQEYATIARPVSVRPIPQYGAVHENRWSCAEPIPVQSHYPPSEFENKPINDFRGFSNDALSVPFTEINSKHKHFYNDCLPNENCNLTNNHPSPMTVYSRNDLDAPSVPIYSNVTIESNRVLEISDPTVLRPHDSLSNMEKDSIEVPSQHRRISPNLQVVPTMDSSQHDVSDSSNDVTLNDTIQYNEAAIIDIPQEMLDPLPLCNGNNFPYPGNVEVNVVSVGHFQPYWEETKPYELSDFYKYSTKHRKSQSGVSPESINHMPHLNESDEHCWTNQEQDVFSETPVLKTSNRTVQRTNPPHQELLMNALAQDISFNQMDYSNVYGKEENRNIIMSPPVADPNNSFGEVGIRVSVADSFHDEMLAWYKNRETVKKATLV